MLEEIQKIGNTEVYSVVLPDEPDKTKYWFRATEISKFLGYSDTFRAVHSHCKDWQYREFQVGKGRPALYVCESGVYRLILRSKSQYALEFQDWLTEVVLPKLRASGGYIMPSATSEQLEGLRTEIEALTKTKNLLAGQLVTNIINLLTAKKARVTYRKLLEVIQNCLSSSTAAGYTYNHLNLLDPDRMKQIVKAWCDYAIPSDAIDFPLRYRELVPFLRCLADNYYLSGTGGTGEQKYLQQLMSQLPQ